ncbi:2-amino-4-oxopentanoate thiolase subunit OrtA [Proteinivorax tanatarense]|uniref:2-amino-4-oxopentanoate thiolase subunit OrtA n=1 Tax=Proteinivorax tanatarense TaxID=1260629 RepID=A0AAU7VLU3_9FIRM
MSKTYPKGSFVEIQSEILPPGKRANHLPEDTKATPLTMKVKGFLQKPSKEGETIKVKTVIGRIHQGVLVNPNPKHTHDFGDIIEELFDAQKSFKKFLKEGGDSNG